MRTKLTADHVIGFDGRDHIILEKGEVVFEANTIIFTGHGFTGQVDRSIDYGHAVIGPGFIDLDALGDLDTSVLGFDNGPGTGIGRVWSEHYLRQGPVEAYTAEEGLFKYRYAFTQLIRNGITTAMPITSMLYRAWAETYGEFEAVAAIAGELGLRAYLGPGYMSGVTYLRDGKLARHYDEDKGLAGLAEALRFIGDHDGRDNGRIRGCLVPDRIETQTAEVLRQTAIASADLDVPVRLHCCQSVYEFETVKALHGETPYRWLDQLGLMNPRAILPHGIYVSGHPAVSARGGEDLRLLASSGASIVHCPVVFARSGEALDSFSSYRTRGINIAMGTDTFPPDIIDNMRQGLNISHIMDGGTRHATAADFYRAATLGGAEALGRDDIGRLSPGARADITVFDLSGFHLGQFIDPVKTMVLSGSGRDFRASFIDGVEVMTDFVVRGADYAALQASANAQFEKVKASHVRQAGLSGSPDQLFKPSYRVVRRPDQLG